jgi:SPP1 family predicted phage head-tail adaptor
MNVNIGELNKRIKIVSVESGEKDEDGFPINQIEKTIYECWAKVTQTSGTELIKANAEFTDVSTRFLIRYTPKEINEDMQILFQGKYYDIVYINNYEFSNEFIEILTEKKELV